MSSIIWSVIGSAIGSIVTLALVVNSGGTLIYSQNEYTRCVTEGAPADNCLKIYLLPKETK